ncbi:UPF0602 protein C4orf47 homolog isoform X2 [Polyodon spathula]|uniref:UPF0602 protein C4orf47 homolog isoform X2 n=1 Tax=Polyodon spathula TaxID=7913 RepID=UPI001B7E60CA|nr:UPF0602 protein C4orf47 homolog isoform X2 [Polyodon spathula]
MPSEMKTDMERIGLFSEPTYITIGDKYTSPYNRNFSAADSKNKQMLPGGSKVRSALQEGYFDSQFKRIFEKEAYSDPVKQRRQFKMQQSKKNIGKPFLPSNGEKKPYHNLTLSKPYPYTADPYDREKQMRKTDNSSKRNLLKGGAFFLNLHPKDLFDSNPYKFDKPLPPLKKSGGKKPAVVPFKPSSPPKKIGGMKAGTFEVYPSHSADPFTVKITKASAKNKEGRVFQPSPGPKSRPVKSVVIANIMKTVTPANYMNLQSVMAY